MHVVDEVQHKASMVHVTYELSIFIEMNMHIRDPARAHYWVIPPNLVITVDAIELHALITRQLPVVSQMRCLGKASDLTGLRCFCFDCFPWEKCTMQE